MRCRCLHTYCLLDGLLHRLGVRWQWVCDRHQQVIADVTLERSAENVGGLY